MTESHVSEVIRDSVAIIDQPLAVFTFVVPAELSLNEVSEIKTIKREVHLAVNLLAVTTSAVHSEEPVTSSRLLESFEVNNKNRRDLVDVHLLGGANMILAFVTIPFIVIIEHLRPSELLETVLKAYLAAGFVLVVAGVSNLGSGLHARELLDEGFLEVSLPQDVEDEISLTFVASVEADVVFDTNPMKHVKHGHL